MKFIHAIILLLPFCIQDISGTCLRLPPGLDRLVRGIDITELDLIPTEMTKANGFNHPVIEFTCNTTRKWTNPLDPSISYDIPDQVETINSLPGGVIDYKSYLYKSHEDIKKTMASNVGIGLVAGFFSLSGSYAHSQESILNNVNTISESSAYVSAYEVELKPYFQQKIGASAQQFVDKFLPATYLQNPAKYQEFLSLFGSHFFSTGYFGGFLTTKIEITESLSEKMKDNQIKAEAEATFLSLIKVHGGYSGTTAKVSDDFKKNSHIHEAYYGGDANLLSSGAGAKWWNTVARNPWFFGGKLRSITDLLAASPKRNAISQAIVIRQDKAYIEELIRTIDYVKQLQLTNKGLADNYRNQLIGLRNQVIPNHSIVKSLGTTVNMFALSERNKTVQQCHNKKVWLVFNKKVCETVHNHNPSASYFESYPNKNIYLKDIDSEILDMI